MESFEGDLDPVSLKIMNVYKPKDDLPKLRQENQMLRNKLRQFRDSDNKKTQDLKVCTYSKFLSPIFRQKTMTSRRCKKSYQTRVIDIVSKTQSGQKRFQCWKRKMTNKPVKYGDSIRN